MGCACGNLGQGQGHGFWFRCTEGRGQGDFIFIRWRTGESVDPLTQTGADFVGEYDKKVYDDAYAKAVELQKETGATFLHPFDDEYVIVAEGVAVALMYAWLPFRIE